MKKQKFTKEQIREWMLDSAAANGNFVEIHTFYDFATGERVDTWYIVDPMGLREITDEHKFARDMERGWH